MRKFPRGEARLSLGDELAPEPEITPEEKSTQAAQRRQAEAFKDELIFRYGELEPNHPIQQYIDRIAQRLPDSEESVKEIKVLPGWKEANLMVLADGTILVGSGLLAKAGTEEAILGALAHERVHLKRGHFDRPSRAGQRSWGEEILEEIGWQRSQEWEADLRGVLQELDRAGINPLGYKDFILGRAGDLERGGLIHGTNLDRALNIVTATHLVDFRGIDLTLHEISPEIQEAVAQFPVNTPAWQVSHFPQSREHHPRAISPEHRAILAGISEQQLPLALADAYAFAKKKLSADQPDYSELVFKYLQERFDSACRTAWPDLDESDRERLARPAFFLFTGVDPLGAPAKLFPAAEKWKTGVATPAEFIRMNELILANISRLPAQYWRGSSAELWSKLLAETLSRGVFGKLKEAAFDLEHFRSSLEPLLSSFVRLSGEYDITRPRTQEDFRLRTRQVLLTETDELALRDKIQASWPAGEKNQPTGRRGEAALPIELRTLARAEGEKLLSTNYDYGEIKQELDRIGQHLCQELVHLPGKEILELVLRIVDPAYRRSVLVIRQQPSEDDLPGGRAILMSDQQQETYNHLWMGLSLMDQLIDKHPAFSALSDHEKKLQMFDIATHWSSSAVERDILSNLRGIVSHLAEAESESEEDADEEDMPDLTFEGHPVKRLTAKQQADAKKINGELQAWLDPAELYRLPLGREEIIRAFDFLASDDPQRGILFGHERWPEEISPFVTMAATYLSQFPLERIWQEIRFFKEQGVDIKPLLDKTPARCGSLIRAVTEVCRDQSLDRLPLADCLASGCWITNPFLRSLFEKYALDRRWAHLSFDEKLNMVLSTQGELVGDPSVRENFLERDVRQPADYHAVRDRFNETVTELTYEGRAETGLLALGSQATFRHRNVTEFLAGLLGIDPRGSGQEGTDLVIKRMLYEFFAEEPVGYLAAYNTPRGKVIWALHHAERNRQRLYTLDSYSKGILLRKLLTGEGGALRDRTRRQQFFTLLFDKWIRRESGQEDIMAMLTRVKESLNSLDLNRGLGLLYFAFSSALHDKIANPPPPEAEVPYARIYEIEEDLEKTGLEGPQIPRFINQALWRKLPQAAVAEPWRYPEEIGFVNEGELFRTLEKSLSLPPPAPRLAPLEFIKEFASKTGALGVRFLQLLPQFVSMPESRQDAFAEIYDRVKGQSKIAAIALLEREWPGIWEQVDAVEERVGGGSMVTVYRLTMKDGTQRVAKVANPNIRYHLGEVYDFASLVLDNLSKKYGSGYRAARLALDDIREWISHDVDFSGFLEPDRAFRERYQGYTVPGSKYKLRVPESFAPSNRYFVCEEYRPGTNLTRWPELLAQKHDPKQISSLLVKFYVDQIRTGQVISDVHRGNYAVTPENEIVVYDRNFYLTLDKPRQDMLLSLFNPFASAAQKSERLTNFLVPAETAATLPVPAIQQEIGNFIDSLGKQDWRQAQAALVKVKQLGAKIPLEITLILKNFNELQLLSRRAGFRNLLEAYLSRPA